MPRQILENERYILKYGVDHLCGKFVQIFDKTQLEDGSPRRIINLNERNDGLTLYRLIQTAEIYEFDLSDERQDV